MDAFGGFEPQVGEIRALRTFRIGSDGALYPLFDSVAWDEGTNNARCRLHRDPDTRSHDVPDPDCHCGFYAYGSESAAREFPRSRHVLAVIACWGRVIAGSRGIRAQYARIEALWLSETVPADLARRVAERYPSVPRHDDRAVMLSAHPPTELACYDPAASMTVGRLRRTLFAAAFVLAVAAGTVPLWSAPLLWLVPFVVMPVLWTATLMIVERRRIATEAARFPAAI